MCCNDMLFIGHVCCRGLRRPRGLKFSLVIAMGLTLGSRSAKTSWIEIVSARRIGWKSRRRGLRRPRGLKFTELRKAFIDNRRGLRRPRGLKSS